MTVLLFIAITIGTFLLMECVTWLTHKFVMHGFMWYFHADHHEPKYPDTIERNDIFFVIFAAPSIILFYYGVEDGINYEIQFDIGESLSTTCKRH